MSNKLKILRQLRKAIDDSDIPQIQKIFIDNPLLNWNEITANKLSALWWAMHPPRGKEINPKLIDFLLDLKRNNRPVIDILQPRDGKHLRQYLKESYIYYDLQEKLEKLEQQLVRQTIAVRDVEEQPLGDIARDGQNTHRSEIVKALDGSVINLYRLYHSNLTPENIDRQLKNIAAFIKSNEKPYSDEDISSINKALSRINLLSDTRLYEDKNENTAFSLTLNQTLVLMWLAAEDPDPNMLPGGSDMSPEGVKQRRLYIVEALLASQMAYGKDTPACWMGTRNQIVSSLAQVVNAVSLHSQEMSDDITLMKYAAEITKALGKSAHDNPKQYWSVISHLCTDSDDKDEFFNSDEIESIYSTFVNEQKEPIRNTLLAANARSELLFNLVGSGDHANINEELPLYLHEPSFRLEQLDSLAFKLKGEFRHYFWQEIKQATEQNRKPEEVVATLLNKLSESYAIKLFDVYQAQSTDDNFKRCLAHLDEPQKKRIFGMMMNNLLETKRHDSESGHKPTDLWPPETLDAGVTPKYISWLYQALGEHFLSEKLPEQYQFLHRWYTKLPPDVQSDAIQQFIETGIFPITEKNLDTIAKYIYKFALEMGHINNLEFADKDLSGLDLRGYDLANTNLKQAKLTGADLALVTVNSSTNFNGCDLTGVRHGIADVHVVSSNSSFTSATLARADSDPFKNDVLLNYPINWELIEKVIADPSKYHIVNIFTIRDRSGTNLLHVAAQEGKYLTDLFEHPHFTSETLAAKDNDNVTPFMRAVGSGHSDSIRLILKHKAFSSEILKIQNNRGENALHIAFRNKDNGSTQSILMHSACTTEVLNATDREGKNALTLAIENGNTLFATLIISYLKSNSATLQAQTLPSRLTPLMLAIDKGNVDVINEILNSPHFDRDLLLITDSNHENVLFHLIRKISKNNISLELKWSLQGIFKSLLEKHSEMLKTTNIPLEETPLLLAARLRNRECVEDILNCKDCTADVVAQQDHQGNNALMLLSMSNNGSSILKLMLDHPKSTSDMLNIVNLFGDTVLINAVKSKNTDVIQTIVNHTKCTAQVFNHRDENGCTALMLTAQTKSQERDNLPLQALLDAPACNEDSLKQMDQSDRTLLMQANHDSLKTILDHVKCTPEVLIEKNSAGDTALIFALKNSDYLRAYRILNHAKCNSTVLNQTDTHGNTALMLLAMAPANDSSIDYYDSKTVILKKSDTATLAATNKNNQNALAVAFLNNNESVISAILSSPFCTQEIILDAITQSDNPLANNLRTSFTKLGTLKPKLDQLTTDKNMLKDKVLAVLDKYTNPLFGFRAFRQHIISSRELMNKLNDPNTPDLDINALLDKEINRIIKERGTNLEGGYLTGLLYCKYNLVPQAHVAAPSPTVSHPQNI